MGIYSAVCSFGSLIQLFVSPLQLILLPELSKLYDENNIDEVIIYMSHSLRYFLLITLPAVFGLLALAKPLLRNNKYIISSISVTIYTVLHQLDQKIIYPHYDFKHLTEKYFEIGMS